MAGPGAADRTGVDATFSPDAFYDPAIQASLDRWKQGDLVENVGLFWVGTVDDDPLTGLTADAVNGHIWPVVAFDGGQLNSGAQATPVQRWSVITSQTCDVVATGPGARHPFVQVSPVVDLAGMNPNIVASIERGEKVDRVWVDNVPGGGNWAADLRISLPISKSVLLAQDPKPAFGSEELTLSFSDRVAAKLRRPALHDAIADGMRDRLIEFADAEAATLAPWLEDTEQFRVLVVDGTRLKPVEIALCVVTLRKLSPEECMSLRRWREKEKRRLKRMGITLGRLRFRVLSEMSVEEYRNSCWLFIPVLSRRVWW